MELFDLALQAPTEDFQKEALKWLQCRIGFDGAIWGGGERQKNGVLAIQSYLLSGRPEGLVLDYPVSAAADPISAHFLESPTTLQNVSTHKHYRHSAHRNVRQYLDHYRVRHLQIVGSITPATSAYNWIVCYREDELRPFSPELEAVSKNAVSIALLAEQFHQSAHRQLALENLINTWPDHNRGFSNLTPRQFQVLHYIEQG